MGVSPEEARRRALAKLGGVESVKEQIREVSRFSPVETTIRDLRHGLRTLRRTPLFTFVALLTLALTIGAVSTVLTIAHTFFLRQLPATDPEQLVIVAATRENGSQIGLVSYPDYVHFRDHTKTLESLAAHYSTSPLYAGKDDYIKQINGAVVSANFFSSLGLKPVLGRFFDLNEDQVPDRDRVAVLSHYLWRTWFDASPEAVGQTIDLNGTTFTVIGVAPDTFQGMRSAPTRIFLPMMMLRVGYRWCTDALDVTCTVLSMIGRRAANGSLDEVSAELATLVPEHWRGAASGENTGIRVELPRGSNRSAATTQFVKLLFVVAAFLFVVCCANLAGLLISRGSARTRELSIRNSLGASRGRLIRQLLTESQLLAISGGILGIALSIGLTRLLNARFYSVDLAGRPLYFDFSLQLKIVLAVLSISLLAGLVFGMLPAWTAVGSDPARSLASQSRTVAASSRVGRLLLGAQAAIAVALVSVAVLLSASAEHLVTGSNFEASQVALLRLRPRLLRYPPQTAQQYLRRVIQRLQAYPGVEAATLVGLGGVLNGLATTISLPETADETYRVGYHQISPRYFETLRIPLLRGRVFDDQDRVGSPSVAVVSETLATRLWLGREAVGSEILIRDQPHTIVGVVADIQLQSRAEPIKPYVCVPFWQNAESVDARMAVRVRGNPEAMLGQLAQQAREVDPDVPVTEAVTHTRNIADASVCSE